MHQPLLIGNVHNMSLENINDEQPHLVAQFSCETTAGHDCIQVTSKRWVCCAAIQLHDSQNITLTGINITSQTPGMSGITVHHVSNLNIQLITAYSLMPSSRNSSYILKQQVGILISESSMVGVYSTDTANYLHGFVLNNAINTFISSIMATNSSDYGISLYKATNTTIMSLKAVNNHIGIFLFGGTNTTIIDAVVLHNDNLGMFLDTTSDVTIINPTVMFNDNDSIIMIQPRNAYIINATVMQNAYNGIAMTDALNVHIINTSMHVTQDSEVSIIMGYISITSSSQTKIFNTSFTGIGAAPNAAGSADPNSHPAIIALYDSSLYISNCNFTENSISAVKAYASNITAAGDLIFSNNRAMAGTAFILVQNSILRLVENSHAHFSNNHAINNGGVFYIGNNVYYSAPPFMLMNHGHPLLQSKCFLNIEGSRSQARLTFVNNSAGKGGDILYGGHVALGLDGDWNCLESFRNISTILQDGLSLITSDPTRVCLCNETGQPDCLTLVDPTPHSIYPGQSITIPAVVVGQRFGVVPGSVFAQFLQRSATVSSPQLDTWQNTQDVTQEKCNSLNFTIFFNDGEYDVVLVLSATNKKITQFVVNTDVTEGEELSMKHFYKKTALDPIKYLNNPVYVNILILPCPPGFKVTAELPYRCGCNQILQSLNGVSCHIQDQTIVRSGLVWVGTLNNDNETVAASEYCAYDYCKREESNVTLSEPDSQCNYNHSGTLCGECQPGLSLALGSAQCLPCSNKYLALLIPFVLAGPAVVFLIKLMDLTISQGTINGLIFYANIVKANKYMLIPYGHTNPLTLFIAWLNLDLGVETCFFHGLTAYTKTWLQFVFPIYIWSIAGLIIILAKYSDRVAKVMGNNSVPVLATLFLLSYAKLFRTIITALSYTMLYNSQDHKAVWSTDGNVDYLGPKHAPLFAVAVAVLIFLWLPYTLLLFLGQWLHRCNCQLMNHILMKMKPFLDVHYGSLKGKHRYWFGTLLLARAAILLMSALIPLNHLVIVNFCVSVSATILMFLGMIVYRNIMVAVFDISFIMNLALLSVATMFTIMVGGDEMVVSYTLIGIAFIQFIGLVLFKLFSILKGRERIMACLHRRQPVEDDWELYEEAALQREMESDAEEEDSEGSESTESLPTY